MRNVTLAPGRYIAAVSGGVDSVALLDMLHDQPGVRLIVAHVDHGIRPDSGKDAELVRRLADHYKHPFEMISLSLGPQASEATAREMRYAWLTSLLRRYQASAILTAHHQDDIIETILINLLRGTGWRGLSSLRNTTLYRRPLLRVPKAEIVHHAIDRNLEWREDSTNDDVRYLRNYIRHGIVPKLSKSQIADLVHLYERQCELRQEIKSEREMIHSRAKSGKGVSRYWLIMTSDEVAKEFLRHNYGSLTHASAERLLHFARVARPGTKLTLNREQIFRVTPSQLIVCTPEDC